MVYEAIIHYGLKHQAEHTCFATSHCQNQAVKCETYQVYLLLLGRGRLFRGFLRRFFFSRFLGPASCFSARHFSPLLRQTPVEQRYHQLSPVSILTHGTCKSFPNLILCCQPFLLVLSRPRLGQRIPLKISWCIRWWVRSPSCQSR